MHQIIEIKNLSAGYNHFAVLEHINLNVFDTDFIGIIGPNGGGKTTLIKCILGLIKPFSGEINFSNEPSKVSMGYLPQVNSIDRKFPVSVEEVILSGIKKSLTGRFNQEEREQAHRVIQQIGLEGFEKRSIEQLSGGQLQRALLGRAIISNPTVLVLDEPNTYIDKQFEAKLYDLLKEINRQCAIILVSHDIHSVLQQTKSIAYVNNTLSYCPDKNLAIDWLEKNFNYSLKRTITEQNSTKCCF